MITENQHETVIILDFGSQYTQLIARRVREAGVYCEILPFNTPIEKVSVRRPKGLILSGSPSSVYAGRCAATGRESDAIAELPGAWHLLRPADFGV